MSRFKEKRRIEAAIDHKNMDELKWSLSYCQMRLKTSTHKDHDKTWKKTIDQIESTMKSE